MLERLTTELPFAGKKIYFSASIRGVVTNIDIAPQLIKAMQVGGANVLSEHVGAQNKEEMFAILSRNSGIHMTSADGNWQAIRRIDMNWVDQATHLVSVVDGPSHGVGAEIERALGKPEKGLNITPILALIHEDNLKDLTAMIRGIANPEFRLAIYHDIADAKRKVVRFLKDSNAIMQKE